MVDPPAPSRGAQGATVEWKPCGGSRKLFVRGMPRRHCFRVSAPSKQSSDATRRVGTNSGGAEHANPELIQNFGVLYNCRRTPRSRLSAKNYNAIVPCRLRTGAATTNNYYKTRILYNSGQIPAPVMWGGIPRRASSLQLVFRVPDVVSFLKSKSRRGDAAYGGSGGARPGRNRDAPVRLKKERSFYPAPYALRFPWHGLRPLATWTRKTLCRLTASTLHIILYHFPAEMSRTFCCFFMKTAEYIVTKKLDIAPSDRLVGVEI